MSHHTALSQVNTLQPLEHLKPYPLLRKRLEENALHLHGWWFDISKDDPYAFDQAPNRFVLMDEATASGMMATLNR